MKLPMNVAPVNRSPKTMQSIGGGRITPSISWWCLVRCGGRTVVKCIRCGTNVGCWLRCGGPRAVRCFRKCS